jgi:hypothetical protein
LDRDGKRRQNSTCTNIFESPDGGAAASRHSTPSNKNIKPDIVVNGVEGRHREGRYCLNHRGGWVDVGAMRWTRSLNARTSAAPMAVLAIRRKFRELLVF